MDGVCMCNSVLHFKTVPSQSQKSKDFKKHVADWMKYKENLEQSHTFITWKAEAGRMWHWGQPGLGTKTKFLSNEKQEERIKSTGQ